MPDPSLCGRRCSGKALQPSEASSVPAAGSVSALQESSSRGCSAKRVEAGSAYAFSLVGLGGSIFLCWRLYSRLCLIAADGFTCQAFVQLLCGFIAMSVCRHLWQYVPKEGIFLGKVLVLLFSNFD